MAEQISGEGLEFKQVERAPPGAAASPASSSTGRGASSSTGRGTTWRGTTGELTRTCTHLVRTAALQMATVRKSKQCEGCGVVQAYQGLPDSPLKRWCLACSKKRAW